MAEVTPQLAKSRPTVGIVTGWTIFFMVLLRVFIGWHFFYEGAWKLMQPDWQATSFLVQSCGPFRPLFRWMVKDVDGLEAMTEENALNRLDEKHQQYLEHYRITDTKQKEEIEKVISDKKEYIQQLFRDPAFLDQIATYKQTLERIQKQEANQGVGDFEQERLQDLYARKAKSKAAILTRVNAAVDDLPKRNILGLGRFLTEKQLAMGPLPPDPGPTEWIDWANMLALTAIGACLMLGLFTRLAAFGGICLLAMYYFAMPPFPGLPHSPMSEGHYLIINKNLIELVALLMIMSSRIGRWGGLDAFFSAMCCPAGKATSAAQGAPKGN